MPADEVDRVKSGIIGMNTDDHYCTAPLHHLQPFGNGTRNSGGLEYKVQPARDLSDLFNRIFLVDVNNDICTQLLGNFQSPSVCAGSGGYDLPGPGRF